ncbi:MAG: hypothetical protein HQ402_02365 [Parcubacteria group bacterium]|nr:hypothetical protein [Parcubacteria group bacterium]
MSIKDFLLEKMIRSKMKDVPQAEQDKMISLVSQNPELFKKIAMEVQEKMKSGKDQMTASMEVMQNHKEELSKIVPK